MRTKKILLVVIAIATMLVVSSILAVSQACWIQKPQYIGYDFKAVLGKGTTTYSDTSGAPNLIVFEGNDSVISANMTIDGKTYYYPNDFSYQDSTHFEFSAITGEGFITVQSTFTFTNLPGKPTVTDLSVNRVTNFPATPSGPLQNARFEGEFKLVGTGQFALIDCFGLTSGRYLPPDMNFYAHHYGLIKGWPY